MPARIPASHVKNLDFDFDLAVASYRKVLAEWAQRPVDWDPTPPPMPPHPLVGLAVTVGDYQVVEATPPAPPAPSLEERKLELAREVQAAQRVAAERIAPQLKRPLIEMRTRMAAAKPWADRTMGDREALNDHKGLNARLAATDLHAAEQLAAIADLTEDTIEGFKIAPFPEAAPAAEPSLEQKKKELADEVDAELQRQQNALLHPLKRPQLDLQFTQAAAVEPDKRSDAQKQAIADREAIDARSNALALHAARQKAAIAELTSASIDAWKPEPFPTV